MRLLLGVDGGGTKTDAALCDETGRVLRRASGPETNPNGQSREQAEARLKGVIEDALGPYAVTDVIGAFAGIAGTAVADVHNRYGAFMRGVLRGAANVRNGSDVMCAMSGSLGMDDGIAAIAGTGSSTFTRVSGAYASVGGWGYFFEDAGSGFEIGRAALVRAMRALDGRDARGKLVELVERKLGGTAGEKLSALYAGGRTVIASFAPCVFEAQGDPAADAIIEKNARGYAELLRTGAKRFTVKPVRVALCGGVWKADAFRNRVTELCGADFAFVKSDLPPVFGAMVEAAHAAGVDYGDAFRSNFRDTLPALG